MIAIRFEKHLKGPIEELPELAPLVGKIVRITATDEPEARVLRSLDQLRGQAAAGAFDGFDDAVREWRQEPWRAAGDE